MSSIQGTNRRTALAIARGLIVSKMRQQGIRVTDIAVKDINDLASELVLEVISNYVTFVKYENWDMQDQLL